MPVPAPFQTMLVAGMRLDARRAVFFPDSATLAVADLHLGYAWARRARGALLPVAAPDDTVDRLAELVRDHAAKRLVVLGDIVHEALALPALEQLLRDLCVRFRGVCPLSFCLGNHDRRLGERLRDWQLPITCEPQIRLDAHLLLHGDHRPMAEVNPASFRLEAPIENHCVIGHEHPAVVLDDGVASRVKCPAFLVADNLLVLPAFSCWAAGCEVGRQPFMGPLARAARFHTAYACVGPRLLRWPRH